MTFFIRSGNTFRVTDEKSLDIHQTLPPSTFTVKYNEQFGYYFLEGIDDFTPLTRYYGNLTKNVERILNTYQQRPGTTGVMLNGEKGSGKTLIAKELAVRGYALGWPTIVVNRAFTGDDFNKFIQDIHQEAIIIFDEFEKVFDSKQQESVLTLLDGTYPSKKLFILTCNDKYRVDQHMRNRPGRIYYMIDFVGLEQEFIEEYCNENLENKQLISQIIDLSSLYVAFNFDMLKALVEELNRYGETPQEVLNILNVKPEYSANSMYDVKLVGVEYTSLYDDKVSRNPLSADQIHIEFTKGDEGCHDITFYRHEITKIDGRAGTFEYSKPNGQKLILTRVVDKTFDIFKAL